MPLGPSFPRASVNLGAGLAFGLILGLGLVFVAVGAMILFKLHHLLEIWALRTLPTWLIDLSVSF